MDKLKLIYDIQTLPDGLNLDQLYNIMKNSGIVVWDSSTTGLEPQIIEPNELTLRDVGFIPKEQFNEQFNPLMED